MEKLNTDFKQKEAQKYVDNLLKKGCEIPVLPLANNQLELPPWYDDVLFKRAQTFFKQNIYGMFTSMLTGLIAVLSIPTILNVLISTKQSGNPEKAYKRYVETIFHTVTWYEYDLKPGTRSWKSLEAVRKRHLNASKTSQNANIGIISQKDLALTQFGFFGYATIRGDLIGIHQWTKQNTEAIIHFWRVIGYLIGITDEYNICDENWEKTIPRLELVLSDVYRPLLENASKDFTDMASALINGLWCFNPFLSPEPFLYYTKMLTDCKGYDYYGTNNQRMIIANEYDNDKKDTGIPLYTTMGWYPRLLLSSQLFVHTFLLQFKIFQWYHNAQIYVSRFLIYYFPYLAFYKFGIKKSYVRILDD